MLQLRPAKLQNPNFGSNKILLEPNPAPNDHHAGRWQRVHFDNFKVFVETPPLEGLGFDYDALRMLCKHDLVAVDAMDAAVRNEPGRPIETLYIVQGIKKAPTGNSTECSVNMTL